MKKEFSKKLTKHFITGLLLFIPVWITLYIVWLFFKLISNIAAPFILAFMFFFKIPENEFFVRLISFFLSLFFIYLFGLVTNTIIGKNILKSIENIFIKFPIVNDIYVTSKKLVNFFTEYKGIKGNKVVIVEYPRKGIYSLGIVTVETEDKFGVFIPSTPNPTTGYLVFFPKEEIKPTTINVDEALRIIVSGGIMSSQEEIKKYL
mgnify:CR=1 FL=1